VVKWLAVAIVLVVVAVGLWAFQPWRLFTSSTVDEAAPVSEPGATATQEPDGKRPKRSTPPERPHDEVLATGAFEDAEHGTTGTAAVLELADGRRFVRFERLSTSDGPDLHVWLTDRPSGGDWGSYDDGRYVGLGELKATGGNQNYPIPAGADVGWARSVVIWCDRFNVAFGTAPLRLG
jgi:hypothetical protein